MLPDEALIERVLGGDKTAFGLLIDRHRGEALGLARRILGSRADAEDVAQEAWLAALLGLDRLRDRTRFRGWLLGIVVHLARSHRRREMRFEDWGGGRAVAGVTWEDLEPSPATLHETREVHRLVRDAIDALSQDQRDAVWLHYMDGLRLAEIAAIAQVPLGTVKARIHRARSALRRSLASALSMAPGGPEERRGSTGAVLGSTGAVLGSTGEERAMVEVVVADVIVRAPRDEPGEWLAEPGRSKLGMKYIVLLAERSGERVLPIWLWPFDGAAIAVRLENLAFVRPMPHDLIAQLLSIGGMRVERVAVTSLRDDIFHGSLWVRAGERVHELDVRPSDAITVAMDAGAPIFVTEETFRQTDVVLRAGTEVEQLEARMRGWIDEGKAPAEAVARAYRSFRSLPRAEGAMVRPKG